MALVIGNSIIIKIDNIDYTTYILEYTESGGEKQINHIKTFGNNYISTITGRTDYDVSLTFKFNDILNMDTLFETDDTVTLEVTVGSKKITYNNAYVKSANYTIEKDNIVTLEMTYSIAASDTNTYNKEVT